MGDIIVIAVIAVAVVFAVRHLMVKKTCSCGCDKCHKNSNCK